MTRFRDHFSDGAGRYAAFRPTYPPELADALSQLTPGHERAWDAGCGSGQLTELLASRFGRVIGTDASLSQLASIAPSRKNAGRGDAAYACALAEAAPIATGTVDLVAAAQAAHWFELQRFYREARRVARYGACVALVTYDRPRVDPAVDDVLDRYHDEVLADHWSPRRRHVDSRYETIEFPFAELPTPGFTLEERRSAAELLAYVETWSGTRALVREEGREPAERFAGDLLEAWDGPDRVRTVRWPLTVRAGKIGG